MSQSTKFLSLIFLFIVLTFIVLMTGAVKISFAQLVSSEINKIHENIILNIRLPRLLIAVAAGGGLAVCGLTLQTWFKNQLADPFLLGIHSGSSLGVAIYVVGLNSLFSSFQIISNSGVIIFGIAGALSILLLMIVISSRFRGSIYIIIFGVVISFFITGLINLILSLSSSENLKHFLLWSLGSFDRISLVESIIVLSIVGLLVFNLFRYSNFLNVCLLGDDYAQESGVDLTFLRKIIIPSVGIMSGVVSVYCGPIIFVGLMAPHLSRMLFVTSNHRTLIPATFFIGGILCLLVIMFSNGYLFSYSIPINALLGLLGTPFVLFLLIKNSLNKKDSFYV